MNLEFPVAYLFFPTLAPPGLNLCYCGRQGQDYPSRHTQRGAASLPRLMLDAGGREWARVALKDKELHKPQFFACPPHKSTIYIHNFTYFSSTYQVHLMWNNKLLDLIWRWIQNFTTPHKINKPYEFNWTKNVCHVFAVLKHVTVSFRSMKASRLYLQWMQFLQTFYVWIFIVNLLGFFSPEVFVRQKCLVFFLCVHMY